MSLKLNYYGHSCFSIEINGKTLLFDPFITGNELAKHIDVNTIKADYILLSHGHFDHVGDTVAIAKRTNARVIANVEVAHWASKQGVAQTHGLNTGGRFAFDFGSVKCVNAIHSSVMPDGVYGGSPVGFVIEYAGGALYYAGDTALTMDMKLIPMICPKLTLAVLPIGDNFTMGVADAVIASDFIECDNILGVHYDTFGWIKMGHARAQQAFSDKGKTLHLMAIGETKEF
ncbi:MAG: hydrolase [Bacteroidetes bacterium]|nr:hydrolase [Bacteroidota bacterium]